MRRDLLVPRETALAVAQRAAAAVAAASGAQHLGRVHSDGRVGGVDAGGGILGGRRGAQRVHRARGRRVDFVDHDRVRHPAPETNRLGHSSSRCRCSEQQRCEGGMTRWVTTGEAGAAMAPRAESPHAGSRLPKRAGRLGGRAGGRQCMTRPLRA